MYDDWKPVYDTNGQPAYAGDLACWCQRCGLSIPMGCDIVTMKDERVCLSCWTHHDGWYSAGSKIFQLVAPRLRSAPIEEPDSVEIPQEPDYWGMESTVTGRLMQALEDCVKHQFDIVISEENEWFMELIDQRIEERMRK